MVVSTHSGASNFLESKARRRAGGHLFMSNDATISLNNGAVITVSQTIKAVISSAADAELEALFVNCREAISARR
jgi:S-methylmethionine-dependent homocysteine/selenocysteine methylase